ncbi:hypothetical protein ITP53_54755, partial [Nonomuraea sp. K274]
TTPVAATQVTTGSATQLATGSATQVTTGPATVSITLITGDVVAYTPVENGVPAISIEQAPRPDGAQITFATLPGRDGGWLVLPSDAATPVASGVLDEKLFDVVTLAREGRTDRIPLLVTYGGEPAAATLSQAAGALTAAENVRPLPSIDPAALASATAGRLRLDPVYDVDGMRENLTEVRTLPVVSVGQGREEDFAGVDVAGKLVLAGVPLGGGEAPYRSAAGQMDQAARLASDRGAAGLVGYLDVDGGRARVPSDFSGRSLGLGLSAEQGRALRAAVDKGPVSMCLEPDGGTDPVYRLRYDDRGRIPTKAHRVDPEDLVRIDAQYHADQPNTAGREYGWSTTGEEPGKITYGQPLTMPLARTEYFGPVDDKVTWGREITNQSLRMHSTDRFTRSDRRQGEDWFKAPLAPGAAELPERYPEGLPCVLCRDGDRFVPLDRWSDSDPRHYTDLSTAEVKSAPRLFAGDQEVPVQGRAPRSFTVPDGSADYRLESVDTTKRTLSPEVTTSSRFASAPPSSGTPDGHTCSYGSSCAVQPAILLTYDLPLDLLNRAPAGRPYTFEIGAGPHSSIRKAPDVRRVKVEYSVDDGATWRTALTVKRGKDRYQSLLAHPPLNATSGFVSLRVTASDQAGGAVTQTIKRAYALK